MFNRILEKSVLIKQKIKQYYLNSSLVWGETPYIFSKFSSGWLFLSLLNWKLIFAIRFEDIEDITEKYGCAASHNIKCSSLE